jgi:hypothetical protein
MTRKILKSQSGNLRVKGNFRNMEKRNKGYENINNIYIIIFLKWILYFTIEFEDNLAQDLNFKSKFKMEFGNKE